MQNNTQYLTKEKYDELKKELAELQGPRRKQVAEQLEYAKKLGDLSENAEYNEAREQQAGLEDRISHIEDMLKNAKILSDDTASDRVTIGSTVKIKKSGENETKVYKIVGSEEADMNMGKISNLSPIGSALISKRAGEEFVVQTPKGKITYSLVSIE